MYLEFHHNCYLVLLATLIKYSEKITQRKKVILDQCTIKAYQRGEVCCRAGHEVFTVRKQLMMIAHVQLSSYFYSFCLGPNKRNGRPDFGVHIIALINLIKQICLKVNLN